MKGQIIWIIGSPIHSHMKQHSFGIHQNSVNVIFFAATYFRGQLSPKQFAGIKIHATSTGCDTYTINIRGDHVTAKINTQRNILLLQYIILTITSTIS